MAKKNEVQEFSELYNEYVESKSGSWAETTIRTEKGRLNGITLSMLEAPKALYDRLLSDGMMPYAIRTKFVRANDFLEWAILNAKYKGINPIKAFMKKNAKLFKNVYVRKVPKDTVTEAVRKIAMIPDEDDQKKALQLLSGALRFHESTTLKKDGTVLGKGGKRREVEVMDDLVDYVYPRHYISFVRALKKHTGYKPHDLRKIAAMEAAREGATIPQLMAILGHSSTTAVMSYVQAADAERLNESRNDTITNTLKEAKGAFQDGKQVPREVSKSSYKPTTRKSSNR